jgi:hypothetical protein
VTCFLGITLYLLLTISGLSGRLLLLPDQNQVCSNETAYAWGWLGGVSPDLILLVVYSLVGIGFLVSLRHANLNWFVRACQLGGALLLFGQLALVAESLATTHSACTYHWIGCSLASVMIASCALEPTQVLERLRMKLSPRACLFGWAALTVFVTVAAFSKPTVGQVSEVSLLGVKSEELVPGDAPQIGRSDAVVTEVMFADGQCPYCKDAFIRLYAAAQRPNGPRIVFRHFPLASHPLAKRYAMCGALAAERGNFWRFEADLYRAGTEADPIGILVSQGWSRDEVRSRLSHEENLLGAVRRDRALGNRIGVRRTPTIIEIIGSRMREIPLTEVRARFPRSPHGT